MVFIEGGSVVANRVQKGGIWTFNFQLTASEVGGVGDGGGGEIMRILQSLMEYQVNLIVTQPVVSFIFGSFSQT